MKKSINEQMKSAIRPYYDYFSTYDTRDIKQKSRGHFFDSSAMRFFNSRLLSDVYPSKDRIFFVTSEKFDYKSPRLYTVRCLVMRTGFVETFGEFQGYNTSTQAKNAALKAAYDNLF
jgi:hypothetical protein